MMKKIVLSILSLFFPVLAFSSSGSTLSFAPPPTDVSVVFLGNIFGIVDGVLHGTGSQIMGNMFGVFNSAVLALGGIIIMYTLLVSTMNTAQEGEMLGKKWSSIWVPMRATLGLALLIPKASGYCLMQIFVMWIVLQGVGAADKVWAAALSYLNRGGVVINSQMEPATSLTTDKSNVAGGATKILAGQVCMIGLQSVLETQRQTYLNEKQANSGACSASPSPGMQIFCDSSVPDFLSTVNAVSAQTAADPKAELYSVSMPNFPNNSPYAFLNGICGNIAWSPMAKDSIDTIHKNLPSVSSNEIQTAEMSRAIAIQQMYIDLSTLAQVMVNNNPGLKAKKNEDTTVTPFSPVAAEQFGIPYLTSGTPCTTDSPNCRSWGQDPSSSSAPLFSGTEFLGAISDYNGILLPTLNLIQQATKKEDTVQQRAFIEQANTEGWLMAGSYFFNIARLNSSGIANANLTDTNTGLDKSKFEVGNILSPFQDNDCSGSYSQLCVWLQKDPKPLNPIAGLIDGSSFLPNPVPTPQFNTVNLEVKKGIPSSTVYGFVNNARMVHLANQPGLKPPTFRFNYNFQKPDFSKLKVRKQRFDCGPYLGWPLYICVGRTFGNLFFNDILRGIINFFLGLVAPILDEVIRLFIFAPLKGMSTLFLQSVEVIQQPKVNPVVALANMGVHYINFANDIWILLIGISVTAALIPIFGVFIFAIIALAMPLVFAWLGVMLSIGFVTAYYIPFLPYMIFTFGGIAWLMAVIEAMVAAPLVALGVTHPEGNDAFGKGEHAIMILMNVFLRPAMMIIGYISAIALAYVSVWIINAGFDNAAAFVQGTASNVFQETIPGTNMQTLEPSSKVLPVIQEKGYMDWAGLYSFFFVILIYTTMYLIVVQKSFNLITVLPDKVLRWIGGHPENYGDQVSQWGEESKRQVESGGKETSKAMAQKDQQLTGYAEKLSGKLKDAAGKSTEWSAS